MKSKEKIDEQLKVIISGILDSKSSYAQSRLLHGWKEALEWVLSDEHDDSAIERLLAIRRQKKKYGPTV